MLEEARDPSNPLLERIKFLAIVGSNLNEFFMVRVASLNAQMDAGIAEFGPDRMSPSAQLVAIRREVKRLVEPRTSAWKRNCCRRSPRKASTSSRYHELNAKQLQVCKRYFAEIIFPVLTPLAFDPGRPFPHISNLSLNLAVLIRDAERRRAIRARQSARFAARAGALRASQRRQEAQAHAPSGILRLDRRGDRGQSGRAVSRACRSWRRTPST